MKTKQVIIIRKDLNMRKGKMVAQGAHASMKAIFDIGKIESSYLFDDGGYALSIPYDNALREWFEDKFTKICVSVDSEQELLDIYNKAKDSGMLCSLILDAGLTEFKEPTYTAVAVGPAESDSVDKITGHLKLL